MMKETVSILNDHDIRSFQLEIKRKKLTVRSLLIVFLFFLAFALYILIGTVQEIIEGTDILFYFSAIGLFLLVCLFFSARKLYNLQQACHSGSKTVYSGIIKSLQIKGPNKLIYNISGQSVLVDLPAPLAGIIGANSLLDTEIKLSVFPLRSGRNFFLSVDYPGYMTATASIVPFGDDDRTQFEKQLKAEPWASLRITGYILAALVVFLLLIKGAEFWFFILGVFALIYGIVLWLTVAGTRILRKTKEKQVVTGTITESLYFKHKVGRYGGWSYSTWYRIGNDLYHGIPGDKGSLKPGEQYRIEYYLDKKRKRGSIFQIQKL
ncbi:hypothetical protein HHL16_13520 [Pseudoflavitalea sp. G-6-1-2]|uniref:hypothetical protein n=1 Tax=Pseudoflavitalea sp. G-6-1-2 TaxID=2728841 RepID=UPI00146A8A7F|nr:hypothetical protein [Pseudoflavitalea sp. G-6-1-2]NML21903.1 hypothetical protein [Pseudoflavitalea sp. G-6-1-2]